MINHKAAVVCVGHPTHGDASIGPTAVAAIDESPARRDHDRLRRRTRTLHERLSRRRPGHHHRRGSMRPPPRPVECTTLAAPAAPATPRTSSASQRRSNSPPTWVCCPPGCWCTPSKSPKPRPVSACPPRRQRHFPPSSPASSANVSGEGLYGRREPRADTAQQALAKVAVGTMAGQPTSAPDQLVGHASWSSREPVLPAHIHPKPEG